MAYRRNPMPPNSDNQMCTQTLRAAHYRRLPSIGTLYEIARYVREIAPIIMFQSKQAIVSRYTKLTSTRESNVNLEVKKTTLCRRRGANCL